MSDNDNDVDNSESENEDNNEDNNDTQQVSEFVEQSHGNEIDMKQNQTDDNNHHDNDNNMNMNENNEELFGIKSKKQKFDENNKLCFKYLKEFKIDSLKPNSGTFTVLI